MNCRHCKSVLSTVFADLAYAPVSNSMFNKSDLNVPEMYFPLKVFVCQKCFLVQIDEVEQSDKIFNDEYTYFSSFSSSWLAHSKRYVDMMVDRFQFNSHSQIIEIASNDGYLLQYFKEYGIPVLGIDPTANTAREAEKRGVKTIVDFFGQEFARQKLVAKGIKADLLLGNNVLAHVPDINDFVKGLKTALKDDGVITIEYPHLLKLIEFCQFDTIYHEHFSYLSFYSVKRIFEAFDLEMFDVEEISTHGGSLRIFAKHKNDQSKVISPRVNELIEAEIKSGITNLNFYSGFQNKIDRIKYDTISFLIEQKKKNKKIIGYGAASKGNTLINYCGIKNTDIINFVVDASPFKQNKYLPGSHIPVVDRSKILEYKPDYVIILPWNLKNEIRNELSFIRDWGGKFVIFVPELFIF